MQVAQRWDKPPLTVLAGRPDAWRDDDTLLALAFAEYQQTRLDVDGRPKRLSESEEHADAWDVDATTVNYPRRAMEEWQKANPEPAAGVVPTVVYQPTIRPEDR